MAEILTSDRDVLAAPATGPALRPEVAIREILFPSDLSPESDRAFHHARFLADRYGAHLTLYHALQVPHLEADGPWDLTPEIAARAEKAAREHLLRRTEGLRSRTDVVVETVESVHRAIVRRIHATQPDLTVMSTHGRGGLAHLFLGGVTEMVVQHGNYPVLCVREPDHGVALPYRRVLVPTDLSRASRRAFPIAARLARTFEAEVIAVHVARVRAPASLSGVPELVEALPAEVALRAFLLPEFAGLPVTARVELGSPWDRIIETARTEKADIIVMSTHGHDSVADRVLGSHTERVVRHAPCPVLVT